MIRPDYVKCIADTAAEGDAKAWCGRYITQGFYFTDANQAALIGRNNGHMVACSECTAEIVRALTNGHEDAE